ncbi:MAG: DUF1553 domain-containing protein, partial [Planctomycetales bacterium]
LKMATSDLESNISAIETAMAKRATLVEDDFLNWQRRWKAKPYRLPNPVFGLVAHVPLNETSGKRAVNTVGSGDGTVQGNPKWVTGERGRVLRFDGQTHVNLGDVGGFDRLDSFSFGGWINPTRESILVSRVAPDDTLRGWEVRVGGGRIDARLTHHEFEDGLSVITETGTPLNEWSHVFVTYSGNSRGNGISIYLNGVPQKTIVAKDSLKGSIRTEAPLKVGVRGDRQALLGMIGDVRIYDRVLDATEVARLAGIDPIPKILAMEENKRTAAQKKILRNNYLQSYDQQYQVQRAKLELARARLRPLNDALPTVMVMQEMENPRDTFVLLRGHYAQHGEMVSVGTPSILPPLSADAPANRLGLADWLTDPANPLVGRVTVNRFWQMAFGTGIVETSEDFGTQGQRPSHPKLLDYLATKFVRDGWDTKKIVKHIFMSATYRQVSTISPEQLERDPDNRLLARGPRYRLPAEIVRDSALAVSGLLVEKIGGPSVKPYQPP